MLPDTLYLFTLAVVAQPFIGLCLFPVGRLSRKAVKVLPVASLAALSLVYALLVPGSRTRLLGFDVSLDPLSFLFAGVVLLIGFLCILYSYEYIEESIERYYFWMLTFVSSMLLLVLSDSLLLFVASWELTGLCSYSLIAHRNQLRESIEGAYKAIAITEVGSSMLIVAFALLGAQSFSQLLSCSPKPSVATLAALLLITVAVASKSAQYPLHIWLPDAMPAPTPVSALLHAAAMVKAGVYLLARLWPLYTRVPGFPALYLALGSLTMVVGGLFMLGENDMKRLLAYSTVTQIGYMVSSMGLGTTIGLFAGVFHFLNHAVAKGLLFLSAGSVEHQTGMKDLNRLGGLARRMPLTAAAFTVGALSLSGVPPLNCFVSKWVLYEAGLKSLGDTGYWALVFIVAAFVSSVLSLAALMKTVGSAFFGRAVPCCREARDPGASMMVPLVALSALAVALGVFPEPAVKIVSAATGVEVGGVSLNIVGSLNSLIASLLVLTGVVLGFALYALPRRRVVRTELFGCGELIDEKVGVSARDFFSDAVEMLRRVYSAADPNLWLVTAVERVDSALSGVLSSRRVPWVLLAASLAAALLYLAEVVGL